MYYYRTGKVALAVLTFQCYYTTTSTNSDVGSYTDALYVRDEGYKGAGSWGRSRPGLHTEAGF